jgi:hypothetical protein
MFQTGTSGVKIGRRKYSQKPRQAVVAFEHILPDAAAAIGCQGQQGARRIFSRENLRCGPVSASADG